MQTFVALLRGVNVGGRQILKMADLVTLLENLGLKEVRTYIQSGNVVFRSEEEDLEALSHSIAAAIHQSRGFEPRLFVMPLERLERALASNPFPEAEAEPKTLHLYFLESDPEDHALSRLEAAKSPRERFMVKDRVLYIHTPGGLSKSKVAEFAERWLKTPMTGRNWRTSTKILALAQ